MVCPSTPFLSASSYSCSHSPDITVRHSGLNGSFFIIFFKFIYLFLAVLGLHFCATVFPSCGEWGPLFIAMRGPFTITASLVVEHGLQTCRLSNCGSRAQLLRSMWDLPGPGLEPVSPALAGRLSTTVPPGKPGAEWFLMHLPVTGHPVRSPPQCSSWTCRCLFPPFFY